MTARMPAEDPSKQEVTRCIRKLLARAVIVEKCSVCVRVSACVCVCAHRYIYTLTHESLHSIFIWFFGLHKDIRMQKKRSIHKRSIQHTAHGSDLFGRGWFS